MNKKQYETEMDALLELIALKIELEELGGKMYGLGIEVDRLEKLINWIEYEEILKGDGP